VTWRAQVERATLVEWTRIPGLAPYEKTVAAMEARAALIADGAADEAIWLLEHPPLYTAGTSAKDSDLIAPDRFPVFRSGRGGQYTYHGPGQRVIYVMLDLQRRGADIRRFVQALEGWVIEALAGLGVTGEIRPGRVGVWVVRAGQAAGTGPATAAAGARFAAAREDKIAAIGIRLRRWVSFHGIAINVAPDLSHFEGIVPCGIRGYGVTSLADLGVNASMEAVDAALRASFDKVMIRADDPP